MKLYHAAASPFVRKVQIALIETGLIDQTEIVPSTATPLERAAGPIAQNPLGKIPALERDDGPALYDSRVILQYLDAVAGGGLYPEGSAKWDIMTLEATADGIMDAAVLAVYEARVRPEDMRSETWLSAQWGKIERALDALEGRWMSHLEGPMNAGQIAVACALGYLDFRHNGFDWRTSHPALAAWYDGFSARDSMTATAPKG